MRETLKLNDTLVFMHALLEPEAYVGMGNDTNLITAPFHCSDGVHQGAVEAGWLFGLTTNKAFQNCHLRLVACGGGIMAIIDDHYVFVPPHDVFTAKDEPARDLLKAGLKLQLSKLQC